MSSAWSRGEPPASRAAHHRGGNGNPLRVPISESPIAGTGDIHCLALHHRTHPRLQGRGRGRFPPFGRWSSKEELRPMKESNVRADGEVDEEVQSRCRREPRRGPWTRTRNPAHAEVALDGGQKAPQGRDGLFAPHRSSIPAERPKGLMFPGWATRLTCEYNVAFRFPFQLPAAETAAPGAARDRSARNEDDAGESRLSLRASSLARAARVGGVSCARQPRRRCQRHHPLLKAAHPPRRSRIPARRHRNPQEPQAPYAACIASSHHLTPASGFTPWYWR